MTAGPSYSLYRKSRSLATASGFEPVALSDHDVIIRLNPADWREGGWAVLRDRPSLFFNLGIGLVPARVRTAVVTVFGSDGTPVSGAVATGRWFRFPFMERFDVQIGDVWTSPSHRGRGFATEACASLMSALVSQECNGDFYWIADDANIASIELAKRLGYEHVGCCDRTRPWPSGLLGQYRRVG